MIAVSHFAKNDASSEFRSLRRVASVGVSHTANMDDTINGGPNHLRAWRLYRAMTVEQVAAEVGTSPGQLSDLENDNRKLSAKWLRRLATALKTTPGHLLDHNPNDLPTSLAEAWFSASDDQKKQLIALAAVVLPKDGTHG